MFSKNVVVESTLTLDREDNSSLLHMSCLLYDLTEFISLPNHS
ncbi:hypothetical protein SShM2_204 [Synechococcus phage S-ShM2]|uniref:Uncharacterized protein n=1 Tax=Synechococcus phage S-ShM2 TaxID=445683 RepID=E3SJM4_9CAUD|nr:hypothetical protein SShM2_204 [Synechococcus phage S-ShM2]ADO97814.1 hypothetical protein SShM2_204 [Synechococcus phage S-ShM2]